MNVAEYRRMFEAEDRQWWYVGMRRISDALLGTALCGPRKAPPVRSSGEPAPRPRLLDAGCGTGRNLLHFATRTAAVGVDLSPEALSFCAERGGRVVRGSVLQLPFASERFDCVTSFDVLYHAWVLDDRAALAELVRVLAPGGVLLVRVPALQWLYGAHDVEVQTRHRYTAGELRSLLAGASLEVVRVSYCNSLLFPLLAARRTLDRLTGRVGSDVGFLPAPLEALFRGLLTLEARLISWGLSLPVGASVMALARRPSPALPLAG